MEQLVGKFLFPGGDLLKQKHTSGDVVGGIRSY